MNVYYSNLAQWFWRVPINYNTLPRPNNSTGSTKISFTTPTNSAKHTCLLTVSRVRDLASFCLPLSLLEFDSKIYHFVTFRQTFQSCPSLASSLQNVYCSWYIHVHLLPERGESKYHFNSLDSFTSILCLRTLNWVEEMPSIS